MLYKYNHKSCYKDVMYKDIPFFQLLMEMFSLMPLLL